MSTNATAGRRAASPRNAQRAVPLLPFVAASSEHIELIDDRTVTPTTASQPQGPISVPAYGYMRHIVLEVVMSGGTIGTPVTTADYPYTVFNSISLSDVNGAPLFGPMTGFQTYLANVFGAYAFRSDPAVSPDFSAVDDDITAVFQLRIPVEIAHHSGLGSLANQSAAASYKLAYTLAPIADSWSTAPTTAPDVQVRAWLEAWSQPRATDMAGRAQATRPPNHGTTQFWSVSTHAVAAGQSAVTLPRVGSLIRTLIFVLRDTDDARLVGESTLPDTHEVRWDQQQLISESARHRRLLMAEGIAADVDDDRIFDGVQAFSFDNSVSGRFGDGSPSLYLPTVQSTRLELVASWGDARSVEVITNDVAPAEVNPDERFTERNATTFDPHDEGSATAVR